MSLQVLISDHDLPTRTGLSAGLVPISLSLGEICGTRQAESSTYLKMRMGEKNSKPSEYEITLCINAKPLQVL